MLQGAVLAQHRGAWSSCCRLARHTLTGLSSRAQGLRFASSNRSETHRLSCLERVTDNQQYVVCGESHSGIGPKRTLSPSPYSWSWHSGHRRRPSRRPRHPHRRRRYTHGARRRAGPAPRPPRRNQRAREGSGLLPSLSPELGASYFRQPRQDPLTQAGPLRAGGRPGLGGLARRPLPGQCLPEDAGSRPRASYGRARLALPGVRGRAEPHGPGAVRLRARGGAGEGSGALVGGWPVAPCQSPARVLEARVQSIP